MIPIIIPAFNAAVTIDDWYFDFVIEKAVATGVEMLAFGHKRVMSLVHDYKAYEVKSYCFTYSTGAS